MTEGERWARAELERLRFTPGGVSSFLVASWRRSAEVRRARPEVARRAWSWMGLGAVLWVAVSAASQRRISGGLAWWAACALMLDWHLGMVETEDGRPRNLGTADALTLARAWLVPIAWDAPAPWVCGVAAATDVLDGAAARRAGPTRAGRDLEGLVDACFAAAALRGARRRGSLGRVPVALEGLRLGAGVAFAVGVWFGRAQPPSPALLRAARATTGVRTGALIAAGLGRRRLADALLIAGSASSLALLAPAAPSTRR